MVEIAFDHTTAGAVDHDVDEGEAHRDRRVVHVALAPSLGEIALLELHVAHPVDDAAARVLREHPYAVATDEEVLRVRAVAEGGRMVVEGDRAGREHAPPAGHPRAPR